ALFRATSICSPCAPRSLWDRHAEGDKGRTMSACPQCGTVAKPSDKFCNVCGTPVMRASGEPGAAPGGPPPYGAPAPPPAFAAPAQGGFGGPPPAFGAAPGQGPSRCQMGHEIAPGASYCAQGHPLALD